MSIVAEPNEKVQSIESIDKQQLADLKKTVTWLRGRIKIALDVWVKPGSAITPSCPIESDGDAEHYKDLDEALEGLEEAASSPSVTIGALRSLYMDVIQMSAYGIEESKSSCRGYVYEVLNGYKGFNLVR